MTDFKTGPEDGAISIPWCMCLFKDNYYINEEKIKKYSERYYKIK
jgi:hypothetical protein